MYKYNSMYPYFIICYDYINTHIIIRITNISINIIVSIYNFISNK